MALSLNFPTEKIPWLDWFQADAPLDDDFSVDLIFPCVELNLASKSVCENYLFPLNITVDYIYRLEKE